MNIIFVFFFSFLTYNNRIRLNNIMNYFTSRIVQLCKSGLSNNIEKKGGVKDLSFPLQGGVKFLRECGRKKNR